MKFWPFRREVAAPVEPTAPERKAMVLGTSPSLGDFLVFGDGRAGSPSAALHLYGQTTAVSIPVNFIADAFAVLDPILIQGQEMILEHEVLDLLKRPSPMHEQELFLAILAKNYLITGETTLVALGNVKRPPLELQPLSPKTMTPVHAAGSDFPQRWLVSGNTLVGTYEQTPVGKDLRFFDGPLRELMVARNFSTRDNSLLRGQSPLVSASREARQAMLGTQHNVSLLEKGGRVSLVFHFAQDMDDDDFEETKARIRDQFGGATNAGKISITTGGDMNVSELGQSNKDMDYANLQKLATKAVALQYKVPLPLITDERQTMNNYETAKLALYDDAVIPLAKRLFGSLSRFILPRYGLDPSRVRISFNPDNVPALVERRNSELKLRAEINIESKNELRALIGRESAGEEADKLYQPANLVPVGEDIFTDDNDPLHQEQDVD